MKTVTLSAYVDIITFMFNCREPDAQIIDITWEDPLTGQNSLEINPRFKPILAWGLCPRSRQLLLARQNKLESNIYIVCSGRWKVKTVEGVRGTCRC